ncbi:MAG: hypothetical protein HUK13_08045 [Muribaculaceae bacterium]|nr:hypothetical protein [Muribaculaceae bacterium]
MKEIAKFFAISPYSLLGTSAEEGAEAPALIVYMEPTASGDLAAFRNLGGKLYLWGINRV